MARRRDIPWGLWLGCLAAALLAHAALVVPGGRALARSLGGGFERARGTERELPFELIAAEPEPAASLRLVDNPSANARRPAETERIAERDADVERETAAPQARTSAPARAGGAAASNETAATPREPPSERPDPAELVEADDGQQSGSPVAPPEPSPPVDFARLGGSVGMLHDAFGSAGSPTRQPAAEPDREAVLDSRAHLYAQFFARVRERIVDAWDVQRAIDRHDPQQVQLGGVERTTTLRVELDRSGAIAKLRFVADSGVDYLDAEAVRALEAAAPFPNPPDGLFAGGAKLELEVAFVVTADGSARIQPSF